MTKSRASSRNKAVSGIVGLIALLIAGYLVSKGVIQVPGTAPGAPTAAVTETAGGMAQPVPAGMPAWLHVYFTNPNVNDPNTVDQPVVDAIGKTTQTIDITSFDFNLPSVVTAVTDASQRGVQVRMVLDEENGNLDLSASDSPSGKDYNALAILKNAGIPAVNGGRSNGLMHNKIIILDGKTLFMGSWNMSYNDTYRNNNNLLEITDPTIIANYQAKFNELFEDKHFGTKAQVGAKTPSTTIDGVPVENYFSPVDQVMDKLVKYVQGAQKSVHFMIFTYTHDDLANAMIARAQAGLDVQGVIENRGASQGALVPLACAKLPVKVDGNKYTLHHKVIIIDGQTVITGSFNFTKSADEANDDNVLVIHSPAVAALYEQEYQKVYGLGQPPDPNDLKCQ